MGFLGYFFITYFGAMLLKIMGVPGFKEIGWGWFIVAPILVPLLRLLWGILAFCFYAAVCFGVLWMVYKLVPLM